MASLTTRRDSRNRIDGDGDSDTGSTEAADGGGGNGIAAGNDVTSADDESEGEAEWNGEEDEDDVDDEDDEDEDDDDEDEDDEGSDDSMDSTADMEVSTINNDDGDFENADGVDSSSTSRRRTTRSSSSGAGNISSFFTSNKRQSTDSNGEKTKKKKGKRSSGGGGGTKRKDRSERAERIRNRRRKIADIRGDEDLDDSTRKARDAERERASHIIDFEQLEDVIEIDPALAAASDAPVKEPLLCLNVRADGTTPTGEDGTENAPVFVHESISGKLKKHQVIGARFLWSHIAVEPNGFGCVLADFMGLGKTLQVITVVQAFLAKRRLNKDDLLVPRHKHVLILAPTICVRNWEAEVVKWLGKKEARRMGLTTLESSREKKMTDRVHVVKQWHKRGGLLIMGYELYRILVLQSSGDEKIAAGNAKYTQQIKEVYKCLANPGPDLIVLDEGHRVRDHKSKLVKALSHVKTSRRIILTGYPLQNHLEEYWTMVNFARPDFLGTLEEFKNRFVDPIENGQCIDSSEADLRLARQRAYVLTRELKPLVLRRDQQYLFKQLPPKKEWVLLCKLSESQAQLYRAFLEQGVPKRGDIMEGIGGKVDVLGGYHISLAISNHPDVLCESYHALEEEMRKNPDKFNKSNRRFQLHGEDIDGDFGLLDLPVVPRANNNAASPLQKQPTAGSDDSDVDILEALAAPTHGNATGPKTPAAPVGPQHRLKFAETFMRTYERSHLAASGKMMILMQILAECQQIGDRVILFSQSIPTLNTIEKMIAQANRGQRRHSKRLTYLRIDGSTPQQERFRMISQFNDLEEDVDIIMISTKAGGEGINLCAGNRIIIFDVCWNPCNDSQSMCRSYRFGQTKHVYVYRFVTSGTMEKKVYDLQIRKEGVAKRIVDEKTMERKFKSTDLQNYFNLDEFEESLKLQDRRPQQKSTALTDAFGSLGDETTTESPLQVRPSPEEDSVLQRVLAKFSNLNLGGSTTADSAAAASSSPDTDTSSTPVPESGWIVDWFEQETMFEEDLDQQCSPTEQQEIMESHVYLKAIRRLRASGSHLISREGMLVVQCQYCRVNNEVYPEATTKVPVPKSIDCVYCKRATLTAGATPAPPPQAMPPGFLGGVAGNGHMLHMINGNMANFPRPFPVPANGAYVPGVGSAAMAVDPGNRLQGAIAATAGGAPTGLLDGRQLPPHLLAIYQQQQAASRERERQLRENSIQQKLEIQRRLEEKRRMERHALKLKDRCLLVLRRGMTGCQELKRSAESCGAKIAIEVNAQTTDVVSAMSPEETFKFLRVTKLPKDVDLRDEAWLRNEIAKAKGLPLPNGNVSAAAAKSQNGANGAAGTPANGTNQSPATTTASTSSPDANHTDGSRGGDSEQPSADTSSDMIDLLDSDDEGDGAANTTTTQAANTAPTTTQNGAEDEDDDDDDVIEIL